MQMHVEYQLTLEPLAYTIVRFLPDGVIYRGIIYDNPLTSTRRLHISIMITYTHTMGPVLHAFVLMTCILRVLKMYRGKAVCIYCVYPTTDTIASTHRRLLHTTILLYEWLLYPLLQVSRSRCTCMHMMSEILGKWSCK